MVTVEPKLLAATHEAGHVVVATVLGYSVTAVDITAESSRRWTGTTTIDPGPSCWRHGAVIAYAGWRAEELFCGGCGDEDARSDDLEQARRYRYQPDAPLRGKFSELQAESDHLLQTNRGEVDRVAGLLVDRESITASDL